MTGPNARSAEQHTQPSLSALEAMSATRLLPVIVAGDTRIADQLGDALVSGGALVAEVTLRTAGALELIKRLSARGDLVIGAGTVRTVEQADRATAAGAGFIVSPGTFDGIVRRALDAGIEVLPGVCTPTELQHALDLGVAAVKFFPAATHGGPVGLAALSGPFPDARFVPTGGIAAADVPRYAQVPAVLAIGGSWMVAHSLLAERRFVDIARLTAAAIEAAEAATRGAR